MPESSLQQPAVIFLIVIAAVFLAPLITRLAHLPGIIGLILGGVLVGAHGLNLISIDPTIELFGEVGLIYLMFNAGLEIDLDQFQQVRNRAFSFAALSYFLPQISGIVVGRLFGLDWLGSILLGSLFASQTLIAYPVLKELGILRDEAVSITVGATIFTDILSLLVLAAVIRAANQQVSFLFLAGLVLYTAAYTAMILIGLPRLGRFFFRRFSGQSVEFQFLLFILFVAAVLAEVIGMHPIVGAFLAGLAVNRTLSRESRAVRQVLFLGETLFVPIFLISVGMRLDPAAIFVDARTLSLGLSLTATVLVTKFIASWWTAHRFGYSRDQMMVAWGLSQAQAAATLATILVAVQAGVLKQQVFNGAILMILVTSVASPLLTERYGSRLNPPEEKNARRFLFSRIMLPITRDKDANGLAEFGGLLARAAEGKLLIVNLAAQEATLKKRRERLRSGVMQDPETEFELYDRLKKPEPAEILSASLENETSLILLDWQSGTPNRSRVFGAFDESILWGSDRPVILMRLLADIKSLERVVFIVAANTVGVKLDSRSIEAALAIARTLDLPLKVLATGHYVERLQQRVAREKAEKHQKIARLDAQNEEELLDEIGDHDLVLLPSMGSPDRFSASDEHFPYRLLKRIEASAAVLHFP